MTIYSRVTVAVDTEPEPAGIESKPRFEQGNQPPEVPPLALTGERTLPDVPAENYWFRRHLVVYEWIAQRVRGLRVIDMACGEGYGSDVLARTAAEVVGVDANPEAHEHARLRYRRANLRFERDLVETYTGRCPARTDATARADATVTAGPATVADPRDTADAPADAVVFLQTIEHLQDPRAALDHFRALVGPSGAVFVSTPNVLTLAPAGAPRSDNPWHVHEYRAEEFERLCHDTFASVDVFGLYHAGKLRLHELALRAGWDRVHPRLGLTKPFYDRFTPAIAASDFALRPAHEANLDKALDFVAVCRP